jgi:hypothetical protein
MKKIWNYDPVSKEISGVGYADADPLENPNEDLDGVWAIPAHSTTIEPPEVLDGYVRVFNEATQKWGYVQAQAPIGTEPVEDPADLPEPEPEEITPELVNRLRDLKIRNGFFFEGRIYQTDDESRENIAGAGTYAAAEIMAGAKEGDLRWFDEAEDFYFINRDNIRIPMDAQTTLRFAQALAKFKSKIIIAASNLKKLETIPADYDDPKHWPPIDPAPYIIPPPEAETLPDEA